MLPEDVNYSVISRRIAVCCAKNIFLNPPDSLWFIAGKLTLYFSRYAACWDVISVLMLSVVSVLSSVTNEVVLTKLWGNSQLQSRYFGLWFLDVRAALCIQNIMAVMVVKSNEVCLWSSQRALQYVQKTERVVWQQIQHQVFIICGSLGISALGTLSVPQSIYRANNIQREICQPVFSLMRNGFQKHTLDCSSKNKIRSWQLFSFWIFDSRHTALTVQG